MQAVLQAFAAWPTQSHLGLLPICLIQHHEMFSLCSCRAAPLLNPGIIQIAWGHVNAQLSLSYLIKGSDSSDHPANTETTRFSWSSDNQIAVGWVKHVVNTCLLKRNWTKGTQQVPVEVLCLYPLLYPQKNQLCQNPWRQIAANPSPGCGQTSFKFRPSQRQLPKDEPLGPTAGFVLFGPEVGQRLRCKKWGLWCQKTLSWKPMNNHPQLEALQQKQHRRGKKYRHTRACHPHRVESFKGWDNKAKSSPNAWKEQLFSTSQHSLSALQAARPFGSLRRTCTTRLHRFFGHQEVAQQN